MRRRNDRGRDRRRRGRVRNRDIFVNRAFYFIIKLLLFYQQYYSHNHYILHLKKTTIIKGGITKHKKRSKKLLSQKQKRILKKNLYNKIKTQKIIYHFLTFLLFSVSPSFSPFRFPTLKLAIIAVVSGGNWNIAERYPNAGAIFELLVAVILNPVAFVIEIVGIVGAGAMMGAE